MSSVIKYTRTFDEGYESFFVQARICDSFDDTVNSIFITNACGATYESYDRVGKPLVHDTHLLSVLKELSKWSPMHIYIGVTYLDDATIHCSDDDTSVFLIKAANAFVKTKDKRISFYVPDFYKYGNEGAAGLEQQPPCNSEEVLR